MYTLLIEDDDGFQTVIRITAEGITLGRSEENTVRLPDRNVSRHHSRLWLEGDRVYFQNISARYGSKRNGNRFSDTDKALFRGSDVFEIGDYTLRIEITKLHVVPNAPLQDDFGNEPTQVNTRLTVDERPARLVITSSNFAGEEFELWFQTGLIGRESDCDLIIEHLSVSGHHAQLAKVGDSFFIKDLNSSNGTSVNGQKIDSQRLISGDVLVLGQVTLRYIGAGELFQYIIPSEKRVKAPVDKTTVAVALVFSASVLLIAIMSVILFLYTRSEVEPSSSVVDERLESTIEQIAAANQPNTDEVSQEIFKATSAMIDLKLDDGIELLTAAKSNLNPTPEQRHEIDTLIDEARMQLVHVTMVHELEKFVQSSKWIEALDLLEVLVHSDLSPMVESYLETHGIMDQVIDNAIATVRNGSLDRIRRVYVLLSNIRPEDERLSTLEKQMSRNRPNAARKRRRVARMTKEEAEQNSIAAGDSAVRGDFTDAVTRCIDVLKHYPKNDRCIIVMAIYSKHEGDDQRACRFYKDVKNKSSILLGGTFFHCD